MLLEPFLSLWSRQLQFGAAQRMQCQIPSTTWGTWPFSFHSPLQLSSHLTPSRPLSSHGSYLIIPFRAPCPAIPLSHPIPAQPCPGSEFVTKHGLQEPWGDDLGRINRTEREQGDVLRVPLSSGTPGGGTGTSCGQPSSRYRHLGSRQGVRGAERGSWTCWSPVCCQPSPALPAQGFEVGFSVVALAISASPQLFLCLSCFT